jgi:drug/metabolite transporter (DMT)-like permease
MTETTTGTRGRVHRAGAFDIRNFIGALIGLYGVVLVIYGIVGSSAAQLKKSDQVNINLWAGIGMVVVAAFFATWARLRPVVVPEDPEALDHDPTSSL